MGLMSNFPFALAPGMGALRAVARRFGGAGIVAPPLLLRLTQLPPPAGTNAFFAFSIVLKYNVPWRTALSAIWIAGFVFAALSLLGVRTWMVRCMPSCIRLAMACGIGLFLAFIGLKARCPPS
jgi:AGZA family xanthine/uracil permease-like MFS transporter